MKTLSMLKGMLANPITQVTVLDAMEEATMNSIAHIRNAKGNAYIAIRYSKKLGWWVLDSKNDDITINFLAVLKTHFYAH